MGMGTPSRRFWRVSAGIMAALCVTAAAVNGADDVRTIRLRQDDAQVRFDSKVYNLKHAKADELMPFVNSAILRYNLNSTIRRVTSQDGKSEALLVSTGRDFLPHVDKIVAALDRPGQKKSSGSVRGTGITRIAYQPNYRAADEFVNLINKAFLSSSGYAGYSDETNTVFWRDQDASAKQVLNYMKVLDRPIPQVRVRLNYYELRDSDLKDWGFDYLAWKNGPGVNLFNVGYNAGQIFVNELLEQVPYVFTSTWGMGGIFTAPQFDLSFIRCLQQSGNANAVGSTSIMMINTPVGTDLDLARLRAAQAQYPDYAPFIYRVTMEPEYQNIAKNVLGRSFVGKSFYEDDDGNKYPDPPALEAQIVNPFICLPFAPGHKANGRPRSGGVIFDYSLFFKSVVERGNTGAELSNSALITGAATLDFNREKVLAVYDKENDVEMTLGLPILCRIPYLRYLFSTVTMIKERSYIVVTAEAILFDPEKDAAEQTHKHSVANGIERRIEKPFRDFDPDDVEKEL